MHCKQISSFISYSLWNWNIKYSLRSQPGVDAFLDSKYARNVARGISQSCPAPKRSGNRRLWETENVRLKGTLYLPTANQPKPNRRKWMKRNGVERIAKEDGSVHRNVLHLQRTSYNYKCNRKFGQGREKKKSSCTTVLRCLWGTSVGRNCFSESTALGHSCR